MPDDDSFAGGTYPTPPEVKEVNIKPRVTISFTLDYDVPENWTREQIIDDIKENLDDFWWYDEEIDNIDL